MKHIKQHYIAPEVSVTDFVTQHLLTGSLDKPGGQIDPFIFEEDDEEVEP